MGYAVRPYRDSDAEALSTLTLAAIRVTGARAYGAAQVGAWAARYTPARLAAAAARRDTILAAVDKGDCPVAYVVLEADGHLDMLYCHPDHGGRGIASRLLAEAEAAARRLGLARLFTEASEIARPVFARAGYGVRERRDFTIPGEGGEVAIHNYAMEKRLG